MDNYYDVDIEDEAVEAQAPVHVDEALAVEAQAPVHVDEALDNYYDVDIEDEALAVEPQGPVHVDEALAVEPQGPHVDEALAVEPQGPVHVDEALDVAPAPLQLIWSLEKRALVAMPGPLALAWRPYVWQERPVPGVAAIPDFAVPPCRTRLAVVPGGLRREFACGVCGGTLVGYPSWRDHCRSEARKVLGRRWFRPTPHTLQALQAAGAGHPMYVGCAICGEIMARKSLLRHALRKHALEQQPQSQPQPQPE